MKLTLMAAAFLYMCGPAGAQDLSSVIYDVEVNGLTPIESLAMSDFVQEWDAAVSQRYQVAARGGVDLNYGWSNFSSGLSDFKYAYQAGGLFIPDEAGVAAVLQTARQYNSPIARLPEEQVYRMFVAAQALKGAATAQAGGELKFCIFIIYCDEIEP
jgi:hypothetical protein